MGLIEKHTCGYLFLNFYGLGQAQIYLATFEPNEFASYPLIKFGKEIPNRFLVITLMSSICDSYESESIIDTD